MSNYYFKNLSSFILLSLGICRGLIAYNRPNNNHYTRSNRSFYNTLRYYFCTSTDIYFKKKEKYENHSKELVNTLNKWIDSISFPNCEYVDGSLNIDDYKSNDEIPLLTQAKDHLDKSYSHIINMHNDTIKDCSKLCGQTKEIINSEDEQSFENIIVTRINSACPNLKIIHKNNVKEYSNQSNIYTDNDVFNIIFKNHSLNANDLEVNGDKLMYKNFRNIAQGEESDLKTLKQVILELISNKDIKKLTEEYHTLHEELENKSTSFKREIRDLYYSVNGGMTLDKPKDCDICKSF